MQKRAAFRLAVRTGRAVAAAGLTGLLTLSFSTLPGTPARAQQTIEAPGAEGDPPVLLQADRINVDERLGIVTASGNVEVSQEERVLLADSLSYNTQNQVIAAQGNVMLLEPDGEAIFAEYMELTEDLREGAIRAIRILLTDRSRVAAADAVRSGGNQTRMRRGVYSPCDICEDDPDRAPLWQLKAVDVVHDEEEQTITYRDAWLEVFGVPVLYTPYFQHPDPTVERQSGLLAPTIANDSRLGFTTQIPYYYVIDESADVTIAPIFTQDEGAVFAGEYRQQTDNGQLRIAGSATQGTRNAGTNQEESAFRGHIDAAGNFNINDTWRWGFDANRATDDTYLRVYGFPWDETLTSRLYAEGFEGRNYYAVRNYAYQGLRRQDRSSEFPVILPEAEMHLVGEPDAWGGRLFMEGNLLHLFREQGRDSRRLATQVGWVRPHISERGDITTLTVSLRGDGYWTEGVDPRTDAVNPATGDQLGSDFTGRVLPQAALEYRYPFVRNGESLQQVITPIIQGVLSPRGGNPGEIPNEDSREFEFDDTNLFSLNRFTGIDRVSSGPRIDYGLEYTATSLETGAFANAFLGQSYKPYTDDTYRAGSGLETEFSDYVGRLQLEPHPLFNATYRFRINRDDLEARRNELNLNMGPSKLRLNLNYTYLADSPDLFSDGLIEREEISGALSTRLTRHWSAFGQHIRDVDQNQALRTRFGLTYQDECFLISLVAERRNFRDRDVQPDDRIFVQFALRNIGEFGGQQ